MISQLNTRAETAKVKNKKIINKTTELIKQKLN